LGSSAAAARWMSRLSVAWSHQSSSALRDNGTVRACVPRRP
jgi:hypothetical protein